MTAPKVCCPDMARANELHRASGCAPVISHTTEYLTNKNDEGYWEIDYEGEEVEGFYIVSCDDTLRVPMKFCPWCGEELTI